MEMNRGDRYAREELRQRIGLLLSFGDFETYFFFTTQRFLYPARVPAARASASVPFAV